VTKRLRKGLVLLVLLLISGQASAVMVAYNYTATLLHSGGIDTLGLNGETINLTMMFNTDSTWTLTDSQVYMYVPSVSAELSISGAHTMTLTSGNPFLVNQSLPIFRRTWLSSDSQLIERMAFVVDGVTGYIGGGFEWMPLGTESTPGSNLRIDQIPRFGGLAGSFGLDDGTGYLLGNPSVSISAVPLPAAVWLFGSGLAGLLAFRRRKSLVANRGMTLAPST